MQKRKRTIYAVYDKDELLVVGTAWECAEYLEINVTSFYGKITKKNQNLPVLIEVYKIGKE